MECYFVTGKSGTGKTTYAKQLAKEKGYSVYISSGSNDVLDSYQGQDCIILDDLRPSCMGLSDLLKMLDNNTSSTVKSRYKNKV
ncbi:AAA family ATPase, partial [Clostridium perfringens]